MASYTPAADSRDHICSQAVVDSELTVNWSQIEKLAVLNIYFETQT